MLYNFLTPGIFLILASIPLSFTPKRFYKVVALILLFSAYFAFCIGMNKWSFYWYEWFLFSDERVLFILTSIFFLVFLGSMLTSFVEREQTPTNLAMLFVYVGATISILFTKNLLYILSFLETMMLAATFIIFSKKDDNSKTEGLNYFRFHILGGTLLLIGTMLYYFKYDTFELSLFEKDNFYDASALFILLGLLINLAAPPFSSWLLGGYMAAPLSAGLIFIACTTKISALLMMQLFAGWNSLIFVGIFTALYGILYSIFENNLRRMIFYLVLGELGIFLIFIGIGERIMSAAFIFIINDLLCIPTLLCSANFISHFLKKEKISEMKNIFNNSKAVMVLSTMAVFSLTALPFTLGYISKKYLYTTDYLANSYWVTSIIDLLSEGVALCILFKFTILVFFKDFSYRRQTDSNVSTLNPKEYWAYICTLTLFYAALFGLTVYFIVLLGIDIVGFDKFFLKQTQHILIVGAFFLLSRKYLTYSMNMYSFDPNILYLKAWSCLYLRLVAITRCLTESSILINFQAIRKLNWEARLERWESFADCKGIGWGLTLAIAILLISLIPF